MTLPITFRGVAYPSIRAAAQANGIGVTTLWRAIQAGRAEEAGKRGRDAHSMRVTVNGVSYPSARAAALALGYDRTTIATYAQRFGGNFRLAPKPVCQAGTA
jgi:hypothetical protein